MKVVETLAHGVHVESFSISLRVQKPTEVKNLVRLGQVAEGRNECDEIAQLHSYFARSPCTTASPAVVIEYPPSARRNRSLRSWLRRLTSQSLIVIGQSPAVR